MLNNLGTRYSEAGSSDRGDFLVRELMGTQPPAYRPAPIVIDPELLGDLFA